MDFFVQKTFWYKKIHFVKFRIGTPWALASLYGRKTNKLYNQEIYVWKGGGRRGSQNLGVISVHPSVRACLELWDELNIRSCSKVSLSRLRTSTVAILTYWLLTPTTKKLNCCIFCHLGILGDRECIICCTLGTVLFILVILRTFHVFAFDLIFSCFGAIRAVPAGPETSIFV